MNVVFLIGFHDVFGDISQPHQTCLFFFPAVFLLIVLNRLGISKSKEGGGIEKILRE